MITIAQAAQKCSVSETRIRREIKAGSLSAEKFGNMWSIDVQELDQWLEAFSATKAGAGEIARMKGGAS